MMVYTSRPKSPPPVRVILTAQFKMLATGQKCDSCAKWLKLHDWVEINAGNKVVNCNLNCNLSEEN